MLMLKSLMMLILAMTIKQQLQPEEPLMSGGIQWNRSFFYVVVGLVDANHGKLAMMFQPNGPPKSCWCCCFWSCWWSQPWIWSNMIFQPNGPSTSGCREGGGGPRPLQQVLQRPLWGPAPSWSLWWWRGGCRWWTMMAMTMIVTKGGVWVPEDDNGDHGTSVSDKIDQKTKVGQNTRFFLRFFSPAHFDHWKLR